MHSILEKRVSPFWLVPVGLAGFPFLLGAVARVCTALGSPGLGGRLVGLATSYAVLPQVLLGSGAADPPSSVLGYAAAGLFYALLAGAGLVGIRLFRRWARRR